MVYTTCSPSKRLQEACITSVFSAICINRLSLTMMAWMSRFNCMGQHSTTWTGVFPCVDILWNSLTWITWSLLWGLPRGRPAGRASLSFPHTQTHAHSRRVPHRHVTSALTHFHQSNDVIKALMRDYSDITGKAAKLNLLASPCAFACLKSERPLGQVVHGVSGCWLLIHTVTPLCQCISEDRVGPQRKKNSDVGWTELRWVQQFSTKRLE